MGENEVKLAVLTEKVTGLEEDMHGDRGVLARLSAVERVVDKLNWKISTFVALFVVIGNKVMDVVFK